MDRQADRNLRRVSTMNPFRPRDQFDTNSLIVYRVSTIFSWILLVALAFGFAVADPDGTETLPAQNANNPTLLSLYSPLVAAYWVLMLAAQVPYLTFLFSQDADVIAPYANIGPHFITNNLLSSLFIILWVEGQFPWAEIVLVFNWFNLVSLYFRHTRSRFFVHIPVIAFPLVWTSTALVSNGAIIAVGNDSTLTVLGHIALWLLFLYILFFLLAFQDYGIGIAAAILAVAMATQQFILDLATFQYISAFFIAGLLILLTLLITIPGLFGLQLNFGGTDNDDDGEGERQPLLDNE